jgi:hypothetical protein
MHVTFCTNYAVWEWVLDNKTVTRPCGTRENKQTNKQQTNTTQNIVVGAQALQSIILQCLCQIVIFYHHATKIINNCMSWQIFCNALLHAHGGLVVQLGQGCYRRKTKKAAKWREIWHLKQTIFV